MEFSPTRNNFRYVVFETSQGRGYATFCLLWTKNNNNLIYNVGISFCSPHDRFVKKMGRKISTGRLASGKTFKGNMTCGNSFYITNSEFEKVLSKLFEDEAVVPTWAQKAYSKKNYHLGLKSNQTNEKKVSVSDGQPEFNTWG